MKIFRLNALVITTTSTKCYWSVVTVGLRCGNFGNWRYPGTLPLLWDKRYRNRQVEEVSNRLTENGCSKFEKPCRKVEAGWGGMKLIKPLEDSPLRNSVGFQLSRWTYESGGDSQGHWIYWHNDYWGIQWRCHRLCTSDLTNHSPYGLDIGFMIKASKSSHTTTGLPWSHETATTNSSYYSEVCPCTHHS